MPVQTNKGFSKYTDPGLLEKTQFITTSMAAKPTVFPSPHPDLDAAVAATAAYATALLNAKSGNKTDIVIKNQKKEELVVALENLGSYVDFIAKGDESILSDSGFDIRRTPETGPDVVKPEIVVLEDGSNAGTLNVKIRKVAGARSYIYQYTTTDPTLQTSEWSNYMCTVTKFEFKNLESGKRYWCRVAAVGSKDQVVYGDPISRIPQ